MTSYFIDSGYLIAIEDSSDQYHKIASKNWKRLLKDLPPLITTSYILDEVATFFNKRGFHSKAVSIGDHLMESSYIRFVQIDENLFKQGWNYFKQYSDKSFSLTDCISFSLMKNLNIQTALTFDKHFIQAGFQIQPT